MDDRGIATGTRADVLRAAQRVVARDGVASLTLEAVAREAGRSKGGLLYHFPSKEALIQGLIADLVARFDAEVERRMARDPLPAPGRWLRAFLDATAAEAEADADYALGGGIFAAVAQDMALLEPIRSAYRRWQERAVADGVDPAAATIVRIAADGLWLGDMFAFAPLSGSLRAEVVARLRDLTITPPVTEDL